MERLRWLSAKYPDYADDNSLVNDIMEQPSALMLRAASGRNKKTHGSCARPYRDLQTPGVSKSKLQRALPVVFGVILRDASRLSTHLQRLLLAAAVTFGSPSRQDSDINSVSGALRASYDKWLVVLQPEQLVSA
ncbi:MAG: hypothetical protein MHM6MM_006558 [Cercozoa sp. M6MM]